MAASAMLSAGSAKVLAGPTAVGAASARSGVSAQAGVAAHSPADPEHDHGEVHQHVPGEYSDEHTDNAITEAYARTRRGPKRITDDESRGRASDIGRQQAHQDLP